MNILKGALPLREKLLRSTSLVEISAFSDIWEVEKTARREVCYLRLVIAEMRASSSHLGSGSLGAP